MTTVLLIIHVLLALALIGVVLLQRSEGGALGIGGGGGFMTGRGAANFLTRVTAGLAAAFFSTSLILSLIAAQPSTQPSILDVGSKKQPGAPQPQKEETAPTGLPQINLTPGGGTPEEKPPSVPQSR